ncbi:MAG: hypothetical protein K2I30_02080 [Clostridia bacterium]|nr:hypothetical protein [Clostridia bacterium]
MKKRSLVSLLLASAMAVSVAAGCVSVDNNNENNNNNNNEPPTPTQPVQLSAPQITLTENVISWSAVDNATGYDVYEGTTTVSTAQTALSYTINKTEAGEYTFTVKAVSTDEKYTASNASNSVTYTVKGQTPPSTGDTDTSVKLTGKVYLVGDSTVCDYSLTTAGIDNVYLPRYGYGTQLYNYLNCDQNQIVNLARSGRSSLDFLGESNYTTLKNSITAGDYLIIGFGHNDEKSDDAARYTNPTKSYTDESKTNGPSFQYTLYENYVKLAKDKGATPILCTPIVRYDEKGNYTKDKVHITDNGDYAQAIRTLGEATDTTVIDLTAITKAYYMADNAKAVYYHTHSSYVGEKPNETPNGTDATHINKYGAKKVSYELAKALLSTDCPLKANVITNAVAPTFEVDYKDAIREDYVNPDYEAPVLGTSIGTTQTATAATWYKSAFGNLGGNGKVGNFTISYDNANDKFTVGNGGNTNGKFESAGDGFGTAFVQIEANKNFTASAKIKLTNVTGADAQSGFGMMIRDDMYMNIGKDLVVNGNFVAAGALGTNAIFKREETKLTNEGKSTTVNTTNEYTVSITRLGQKITATFSDGTNSYTQEYLDVKLGVIDNDYMYLCLFANRGLVAEFTNVQFEITGDAIGA